MEIHKMKKIAFVLMAVLVVSSVALSGDMAKQGQWGVSGNTGSSGSAAGMKFMLSDNMALNAMLKFSSNSPGGGGTSTSSYGVGLGVEYHMAAVGGVSPYFGGALGFSSGTTPNNGSAPTSISLGVMYGGEYFFSSNFSLAGDIGLGFNSYNSTPNASSSTSASNFGLSGIGGFTATWYLN